MTKRKSANLTAEQLVESGNLNQSLIGAIVTVIKDEETYCGTLKYFYSKQYPSRPSWNQSTDNKPSDPYTTVFFVFDGGAKMEFNSNADDVNIEVLYPEGVGF